MKKFALVVGLLFIILSIFLSSCYISQKYDLNPLAHLFRSTQEMISPWVDSTKEEVAEPPFLKYSISNLKKYPYQTSDIILTELINESDGVQTFLFKYQSMNKTMTGSANLPTECLSQTCPVIIMVRGYATPEQYSPGFGTRNAARVFAQNRYITLAPDFFGFAGADPEPENSWEARFVKPINVIELVKSIQTQPTLYKQSLHQEENNTALSEELHQPLAKLNPDQVGFWAHSNGGQITLTTLQVLSEPLPATLWAPVTAPFPYSILFFTRTSADEGKEARAWLALLEKEHDLREFSVTQHLQYLTGPIQIHHGGRDPDALQAWSDSFAKMVEQENQDRREQTQKKALENATSAANSVSPAQLEHLLEPILLNYFIYPNADHNLQPAENWDNAIQRDLEFFSSVFENN